MEKQITTPAVKGLIIALALIIFQVAITLTHQEGNKSLGIIPIAVLLGGIIWACMTYSSQMDGNVTFGNVFSHGFKSGSLVAALVGLWLALSLTVIFPESLDRMMELQRTEMLKNGMTNDQADQYLNGVGRKMAVPMGTIVVVILYLVISAIGGLLGASLAKKNPNPVMPEKLGN